LIIKTNSASGTLQHKHNESTSVRRLWVYAASEFQLSWIRKKTQENVILLRILVSVLLFVTSIVFTAFVRHRSYDDRVCAAFMYGDWHDAWALTRASGWKSLNVAVQQNVIANTCKVYDRPSDRRGT
jgi:hypothetical protein